MAALKSGNCTHAKIFELQNGMILQVDVYGFVSGNNAKVKLQLQNCTQQWILHWGCITNNNKKWFIPAFIPSGTSVHKKSALRTPFIKDGDAYVVAIELKDPKIHAIEFVLKDTKHDKWLKMNGVSFHINIHEQINVESDGSRKSKCLLNEMSDNEVEKPLRHRNLCRSALFPKLSTSSSNFSRKDKIVSNMYAMSLEEACNEMVGEKSNSIRFLSKKLPEWIRFPASVVLPFGVFEKVLSEDINKEVAKEIACLCEDLDVSKLKTIQETVLQMKAPRKMSNEVRKKMKSSRIPWPQGHGEDAWNRIWESIKKVWASKWNERAYKNKNHDTQCIGILIQERIRADYAFVTYTNHPVSRDTSQIYTEIVIGSVETLVGASQGRAMSSVTKKIDLKSPIVTCYPSKSIGLYANNKRSIVFRPDFVSKNTNRHTCRGKYDRYFVRNMQSRFHLGQNRCNILTVETWLQNSYHLHKSVIKTKVKRSCINKCLNNVTSLDGLRVFKSFAQTRDRERVFVPRCSTFLAKVASFVLLTLVFVSISVQCVSNAVQYRVAITVKRFVVYQWKTRRKLCWYTLKTRW